MDAKNEFDFPLSRPLLYATKEGSEEEGQFIKLTQPSSKQLTHCAILKQAFIRAVAEQAKNNDQKPDESKDSTIKGTDVIFLLYGSESADMSKLLLSSIELFTSGVCTVEGESKLTKPLIAEMSNDDLESMLGEYMANFILLSVLKEMK